MGIVERIEVAMSRGGAEQELIQACNTKNNQNHWPFPFAGSVVDIGL